MQKSLDRQQFIGLELSVTQATQASIPQKLTPLLYSCASATSALTFPFFFSNLNFVFQGDLSWLPISQLSHEGFCLLP